MGPISLRTTPLVIQLVTVMGLPVEEKGGVHVRLIPTRLQTAFLRPTIRESLLTCPLMLLHFITRLLHNPFARGLKATPTSTGTVLGQHFVREVGRAAEDVHITFVRPNCPFGSLAEVIATLNIPVTEALTVFLQGTRVFSRPLVITCFRWPVGLVRQPS